MSIVQEILPFTNSIQNFKETFPETFIRYKFKNFYLGYIKTSNLDLIVLKFIVDEIPSYSIYDMNDNMIYGFKTSSEVRFFTIRNTNVIISSTHSEEIFRFGDAITHVPINFTYDMYHISEMYKHENLLYYRNNRIVNHKTLIVFANGMFYRICYNINIFIIIKHSEEHEKEVFNDSKVVDIDPSLLYLFNDLANMTVDKFARYCQIIDINSFNNISNAINYMENYYKCPTNQFTAEAINNELNKNGTISKNQLKLLKL